MWCFGSVVPFVLGAVVGGGADKIMPAIGTAVGVVLAPVLRAGKSITDAASAEIDKKSKKS